MNRKQPPSSKKQVFTRTEAGVEWELGGGGGPFFAFKSVSFAKEAASFAA